MFILRSYNFIFFAFRLFQGLKITDSMWGLTFPYKTMFFSTKNGPINFDGHVYKITDLDNTYFSHLFVLVF